MVQDSNMKLHINWLLIVLAFLSQPVIVFHPPFYFSFWYERNCEFKLVILLSKAPFVITMWQKQRKYPPYRENLNQGCNRKNQLKQTAKKSTLNSKIWTKEINEQSWRRSLFKTLFKYVETTENINRDLVL